MTEFSSRNPRTGATVATFTAATPEEVRAVVARGRLAQKEWGALSHEERRPYLKALRDVLVRHADDITGPVVAETGKHWNDALVADVLGPAGLVAYLVRRTDKILAPERRSTWPLLHKRAWVEYHPIGVVGVISPWNYPFLLPFVPTVSAVAAGNAVVVKPSEVTPLSGAEVEKVFSKAGFPPGLVQVVQGGPDSGKALVHTADVLHFTGSPRTARFIAAEAAETLTPTILELGGKDAFIVLEDAPVRRAAKGVVFGAMFNGGQACASVERVYVVAEIYDAFLEAIVREMGRLNAGGDSSGDIGAISFRPQFDVIEAHVADAVAKGASVVCGGKRADVPGDFYEPTLLVDVDHSMEVMREETFGPVLAIQKVADEEEAIRFANDTEFGLHGSVWSRDVARAKRVASSLRTGSVAINDVLIDYGLPDLPLAGIGESGYGASYGPEGVRSFCNEMAVTTNRYRGSKEAWWFPRRGSHKTWKRLLKMASWR